MAGGTPIVFPAIAVCDGIAMGHMGMKYSLVTRDLIADSTEAMATAHQFDGLVMIPNCDKNVPGLLMAAARLNIPTIFCLRRPHAGRPPERRPPHLPEPHVRGRGRLPRRDPGRGGACEDYEENACPTCGSCSGMYTANSMNCLTEAIGMALPGNGTIPAVYVRPPAAWPSTPGCRSWSWSSRNIRPRDIMTAGRLPQRRDRGHGPGLLHQHHAAPARHRPRGRRRASTWTMANEISANTPNLCHLAPAGRHLHGGLGRGPAACTP